MVHTIALTDVAPMESATRALLADPCDVLIATTGIGVRGWFSAVRSWGLDAQLTEVLGSARIAVRGTKALAAVQEASLRVWHQETSERLDDVVAKVVSSVPTGSHVALQLSGEPPAGAIAKLADAGMRVTVVPVYEWTLPADLPAAERVVDLVAAAAVDAVTFTSSPAVRNFFHIAARKRVSDLVVLAFADRVAVACVGPATLAALRGFGVTNACAPELGRLGLMVRELAIAMQSRHHHHLTVGDLDLVVQGAVVATTTDRVELQGREREVFGLLAERSGNVVSSHALLRGVWERGGEDERVVAKAVSRLRGHLEPLGITVRNVVKRGYSLAPATAADGRSVVFVPR
jgi:uroporphyrinogen-III synthase